MEIRKCNGSRFALQFATMILAGGYSSLQSTVRFAVYQPDDAVGEPIEFVKLASVVASDSQSANMTGSRLCPYRSGRIVDAWGNLTEDLKVDKAMLLQLSELLHENLLADPRHEPLEFPTVMAK